MVVPGDGVHAAGGRGEGMDAGEPWLSDVGEGLLFELGVCPVVVGDADGVFVCPCLGFRFGGESLFCPVSSVWGSVLDAPHVPVCCGVLLD